MVLSKGEISREEARRSSQAWQTQQTSPFSGFTPSFCLECSAKFRENVEDVFREAAKVALSALKKGQRKKQRRRCLLL